MSTQIIETKAPLLPSSADPSKTARTAQGSVYGIMGAVLLLISYFTGVQFDANLAGDLASAVTGLAGVLQTLYGSGLVVFGLLAKVYNSFK